MVKNNSLLCPNCGNQKKPWFGLCFDCNEKEKEQPKCEICRKEVPEGHNLCKPHWMEREAEKKKLKQIDYVKSKKETDFREKFEGIYHSPFGKVKSKSELLIAYFLQLNGLRARYEESIHIKNQNLRPDFIIEDEDGNTIILEHFGSEKSKEEWKVPLYTKFCKENPKCFFISTVEKDICNLRDSLIMKFHKETPLNKSIWK